MRLAITGARGRLGQALVTSARAHGHEVLPLDRKALPLEQLDGPEAAAAILDPLHLDGLIHPAAVTAVDACEGADEARAWQVNARAPGALARWAGDRGIRLLHLSTDYVFDGRQPGLRSEDDPAEPIQVYGRTKLAAERAVLAASPRHLVARVSWVFGPEKPSALDNALRQALARPDAGAIADKWSLPLHTADGAAALLDLFVHPDARGLVQVCQSGEPCSWWDWAQFGLDCLVRRGFQPATREFRRQSVAEVPFFTAARPLHTAMSTTRLAGLLGRPLRPWQEAVEEYLRDWQP